MLRRKWLINGLRGKAALGSSGRSTRASSPRPAHKTSVECVFGQKDLVVKQRATHLTDVPLHIRRVELQVTPPETATVSGIEVHEEKWGSVTAQHVYKMRCQCGRSWFELDLPKFVRCPACNTLGLVSHLGQS
jgi:hypothetical protein